MRILDVSPLAVNPPRRGSAVRTYSLLRHLSARHEVRQFSLPWDDPFSLWPRLEQTQVTPGYSELCFRHPLASAANRLGKRAWVNAPLLSGLALEITRPPALTRLLGWADVLLVEFPWQFEYCRRRSTAPCVLASHNVEGLKFASWAEAARASLTIRPWLRHVERMERRAARAAGLVLAVSAADREHYIERYGVDPDQVVEIPSGADTERYSPIEPEAKAAARRRLGPSRATDLDLRGLGDPAQPSAGRTGSAGWRRRPTASRSWPSARGRRWTILRQTWSPPVSSTTSGLISTRPTLLCVRLSTVPVRRSSCWNTWRRDCRRSPSFRLLVAFSSATALKSSSRSRALRGLRQATERLADDRALAMRIGRAARALAVERYDWARIACRLDDALIAMLDGTLDADASPSNLETARTSPRASAG